MDALIIVVTTTFAIEFILLIILCSVEINRLRNLCSQAYQIVGVCGYDHKDYDLEPLMDNLSRGAKGEKMLHKNLLPFPNSQNIKSKLIKQINSDKKDIETLKRRTKLNDQVIEKVRIKTASIERKLKNHRTNDNKRLMKRDFDLLLDYLDLHLIHNTIWKIERSNKNLL